MKKKAAFADVLEAIVPVIVVTTGIQPLDQSAKLHDVIGKLNEIIAAMPKHSSRDRGPNSTREMTEDDARRIALGELAHLGHK